MDAHADFAIGQEEIEFFHLNRCVVVKNILAADELQHYRLLYGRFVSGEIDSGRNRSDLGEHTSRQQRDVENVTQIMWPSDFVLDLTDRPYHRRALSVARQLIRQDTAFAFDMLIDTAPNTLSPTPWHQDAAYWMKLEDTRAVSSWLAWTTLSSRMGACGTYRVPNGEESDPTGGQAQGFDYGRTNNDTQTRNEDART